MSDSEVDRAVASARAASDRIRGREGDLLPLQRRPRRGRGGLKARVAAIAAANLAILIAAAVIGAVVMPLGMFGALAVMMVMMAVTLLIAFAPATPVPTPERLVRTELKALPAQTARWLDAQRSLLPAPAAPLLDRIDRRLDTLGAQLAAMDDSSAAAGDIRRLIGEQLPGFVRDYGRVPAALRHTARNGKTPDQQLLDGLAVIERELGEMSGHLAQGDLDTLETKSRFLEIRYQGE